MDLQKSQQFICVWSIFSVLTTGRLSGAAGCANHMLTFNLSLNISLKETREGKGISWQLVKKPGDSFQPT